MYFFDFIYEKIISIAPEFNSINFDPLLVHLFAALLMGYGLGMAMKHGGSSGGTEVLQKMGFKYLHIPYSVCMYIVDGIIIFAGFLCLDQHVDNLLYVIIFVFLEGFVMDATIFSGFTRRAVYIISDKCDEISDVILNTFSRGVTSLNVVGEYSKSDKKMLMCVLSSREYYKLRDTIEKVDDKAFFYVVRANEVRGEGFSYEQARD